ncbi:MAG: putative lipid II flippase FtsW [Patescibacteria group bacterium]
MRHLREIDRTFLLALGGLCIFGLIVLVSASGPLSYQKFGDSWYFFKHQLIYGFIPGIFIFSLVALFDYRKLKPLAVGALVSSVVLLVLVYIPGVGMRFGGAGRWVQLGPLSFQPSELVKITFLIYVAAWLSARREERSKDLQNGLLPFMSALGVIIILLVLQPNTGSMSVITGSALLMYLVAGAPIIWFAGLGLAAVGFIAILIKLTPYRAARLLTFLHPELDPQGIGYHINQAFLAIGSGGLFGLGYGHSRQKYLYLPEVAGDSIFAVIAEEFGFIIAVCLILAFALLIYRCIKIAQNAPDDFGRFLATGIGSWVGLQAVFNICSMVGLMPITGVTLPFISYGSSALISLSIGMGIIASISRQSRKIV